MNLYKIRYTWTTGSTSSSETKYYESEEDFKVDLLRHHLDIMYRDAVGAKTDRLKRRLASLWSSFFNKKHEDFREKTTEKILLAAKVDNDQWVPVDCHFVEPEVVIE